MRFSKLRVPNSNPRIAHNHPKSNQDHIISSEAEIYACCKEKKIGTHTASALTVKRVPLRGGCIFLDIPVIDKKGKDPCENKLDLEAPKQFIWVMELQMLSKGKNF